MKRNIALNATRLHAPAGFEFKSASRPARNAPKIIYFSKPTEKVNQQVVIENPVLNSPFREPTGQMLKPHQKELRNYARVKEKLHCLKNTKDRNKYL
jgi:hypothetical protein